MDLIFGKYHGELSARPFVCFVRSRCGGGKGRYRNRQRQTKTEAPKSKAFELFKAASTDDDSAIAMVSLFALKVRA